MLSSKETKPVKPFRSTFTSPIRFELSPIRGDGDDAYIPVVQSIFPDLNIRFGAKRGYRQMFWNDFLVEVDGKMKILLFTGNDPHAGMLDRNPSKNKLFSQFFTYDIPENPDYRYLDLFDYRISPESGYTPFSSFHSHLWELWTSVGLEDETVWSIVRFLLCLSRPGCQCQRNDGGPYVVFPDMVQISKNLLLPECEKTRLYELAKDDTKKVRNTDQGFEEISALWNLPEVIPHVIMGYLYGQRTLNIIGAPDIVLPQEYSVSVNFKSTVSETIRCISPRPTKSFKVFNAFSLSRLENSIIRSQTRIEAKCYLQIDWGGGDLVHGGCEICLFETKLRMDEQTLSFEVTEILRHKESGTSAGWIVCYG